MIRAVVAMLFGSAFLNAAVVDGVTIHYTATGSGPTVIFVHGWTCDETAWSAQVPALETKYRVVTIDLPGHGQTGSPEGERLSMDLFARAVESVRNELQAERIVLVGHSMGTPVIVQYARLFPAHVTALVFVDGVISVGARVGHAPDGSSFRGPEGLKHREANTRGMFSRATTPELQARIIKMMQEAPESTAVEAMQAMYDPAIWQNDVLTMPVLAIYAYKSRLASLALMKRHYPRMQYTEIPGTGHFLMLEKPTAFNRILLAFLQKQRF